MSFITDSDPCQPSMTKSSVVLPPEAGSRKCPHTAFLPSALINFSGMPEIVECVDDNDAVDKPMQLANGLDLEIWDSRRMVARLPRSPPKV